MNPHIKLRSSSDPESLQVSPISFVRLWDVSTSSSESASLKRHEVKWTEKRSDIIDKRRLGQPGLQQLDLQPSSTVPGSFDGIRDLSDWVPRILCRVGEGFRPTTSAAAQHQKSSSEMSSEKDSWKAGRAFQNTPEGLPGSAELTTT